MLRLELLGQPKVTRSGVALVLPPKRLALIAYLALEGRTRRSTLADLLYPEGDPDAARRNLRQELHRLRSSPLLEHLSLDPDALELRDFECDALEPLALEKVALEKVAPGGRVPTGELLEGLDIAAGPGFDEWLRGRRETLRQRGLERHRSGAALAEQQGDLRAALDHALALLEAEPLHEAHTREAMRLHALLGEPEAGLERYLKLRALLERELGLSPTPETQARFERLRGLPTPAPAPEQGSLRHPPLIGREALLEDLEHRLSGHLGLVLLEGEPGVGKSALLSALARRWGHSLSLRGLEGAQHTPFLPLLEALRERLPLLGALDPVWQAEVARILPELLPGLDLPPPAPEGRARFLAGLWRALEAVRGGGLLILEDLHDFDPSTLELLGLHPLERVVAALRPEEGRQNPALERLCAALARRGSLERIPLPPLSETETLRLVRALSPGGRGGALFSRRLHGSTGGNPLFVLETLRSLLESGELREEGGDWHTPYDHNTQDYAELPMPDSVQDALLARLTRLGDPVRRLLESAALLGETFVWRELEGATPLSEWQALEALEAALEAGFLREEGEGYRFGHALMRRTLLEKLRPERRGLLHRKLVTVLERLNTPPARLAPHLEGSGQRERAARVRLEAARAASGVYAHREALEHYRSALEQGLSPDESLEVHLERAGVYRTLDDRPHWEAALDAASGLCAGLELPPALGLARADLAFHQGRYEAALREAEGVLAQPEVSPLERGWAHFERGNALSRMARFEAAAETFQQALAQALPPGRSGLELRGRCLNSWAYVCYQRGELPEGELRVAQALEVLAPLGAHRARSMALNTALALAFAGGDLERAAQLGLESARCAEQVGDLIALRLALTNHAAVLLEQGELEAALMAVNRGLELLHSVPDRYAEGLLYERLAGVHRARAQWPRALRALEHSLALSDADGLENWSAEGRVLLLEYHAEAGTVPPAALLEETRCWLERLSDPLRSGLRDRLERMAHHHNAQVTPGVAS